MEDKGDDDYDDDGTAGYDKFSRFTPACKFLAKVETRARALTDEIDQNQYSGEREREREMRDGKRGRNVRKLEWLSRSVFFLFSLSLSLRLGRSNLCRHPRKR